MTEIRYDGPDVEADTSGRVQGLLMATVMAADGLHAGRQAAHSHADHTTAARQSAADRADRGRWAGIPTADLTELGDDALATRWQATARHHGDRDADTARAAIERELTERDPVTMRDYRSWRYAAGLEPGPAMQHALTERETRLTAAWQPLTTNPGQLDETGLAAGWVAALGSHHPDAAAAAATGEQLMRDRVPALMARYDTARAAATPTGDGQRTPGQISPLDAAGEATGTRTVFGPGTSWSDTLQHGHPQAANPTTPPAPTARRSRGPHAGWMAAATHQHATRRP